MAAGCARCQGCQVASEAEASGPVSSGGLWSHGRGLALIVLQSKLPVPHCMQVSGFCTWVSHEFNFLKESSAPSPFLLPHSLNTSM